MNTPAEPSEALNEEDKIARRQQEPFNVKWLTIIIIVAMLIGGAVFYSVSQFTEVQANTRSIREFCRTRNENITDLNYKIDQLNVLVAARLKDRPDGTPNPPDVIAAAEALKEPIPLISCEGL